MFRKTGSGKVEEVVNDGNGVLEALLYNFDFDDFEGWINRALKKEHIDFLTDQVVPLCKNDRSSVWLQGSASRIGSTTWNMTTSQSRAGRIETHLFEKGVKDSQIQSKAIGEEYASPYSEDDERDRSVRIWVYPRMKFEPPPPKKVPKRPKKKLVSSQFKLAMLTGISAGLSAKVKRFLRGRFGRGVALDFMTFIVWDTKNNISCIYVYTGIGAGFGFAFLPPVGVTTHGPWNSFETERPIGVWEFGRWARFTTAGIWKYSYNIIHIETPPGVDNVYEKINTGTTYGGGVSSTVGDFIRVGNPERFYGP